MRALLKFGVIGILINGMFFLVALWQLDIGFTPWMVNAVNYPIAVALSFLSNRSWAFSGRGSRHGMLLKYVFVYAVGYVGCTLAAAGLETLNVPDIAVLIITLFGTAILLFLALNFWVFRGAQQDPARPNG